MTDTAINIQDAYIIVGRMEGEETHFVLSEREEKKHLTTNQNIVKDVMNDGSLILDRTTDLSVESADLYQGGLFEIWLAENPYANPRTTYKQVILHNNYSKAITIVLIKREYLRHGEILRFRLCREDPNMIRCTKADGVGSETEEFRF